MILRLWFLFVKRSKKYNSYIMLYGGSKMLLFDFHEIGNRLYSFRKRAGLTQAEVAEAAGLSDRTYADIERGSVNMRIETILRICGVLHITPDEILTADTTSAASHQTEIIDRLNACSPKDKETAFRLLDVFLKSLD